MARYSDRVVGIIKSNRVRRCQKQGEAIRYLYKRSGDFFVAKALEMAMLPAASLVPRIFGRDPRTQPLRRIARRYGLPVYSTRDINSPGLRDRVAGWKPDLFVSIYMNQLFGPELLAISRLGTTNVHPSLLPRHRGMAPYVWAMSEGDSHTYTESSGTTRVRRYTRLNANQADPTSGFNILSISQPQSNHNAGWMGFGPDGFLYIATGDGGGCDDNDSGHTFGTGNSQDITFNLLGKMLRIDMGLRRLPRTRMETCTSWETEKSSK